MRYTRSTRGVVHLADCPVRGSALPWPERDDQPLSDVLVEVNRSPWLRACDRCITLTVDLGQQLSLDDLDLQPLVVPEHHDAATIGERFEAFHAANPWVLTPYERLTADLVRRGRDRIGIGILTEVLRWEYGRQTTGDDFRINNNFRSRYARLLLERHPEWVGVFQTRLLRAA
jgi:hypothetical protein